MNTIHCYIPSADTAVTLKTDRVLTDGVVRSEIIIAHSDLADMDITIRSRHISETEICVDCCATRHYYPWWQTRHRNDHIHKRLENGSFVCKELESRNSKLV